ncbi:YifB family Mg chelatase-like AAA ATPase [Streptomyces sp. BI20]|uniref:YifB family Mg chelatase-like AAA ATPase n=1 Tax=Streptomyces sp. BI20 TaxID=3403460 RepID=UPI003C74A292
MAFARTCSVALTGVEGVLVEVQADLEPGVAAFTLVGLPDKTLTESRDRVRAALVNSGVPWPQKKLTVGLSPASVPKSGAGFDLAIAGAVLAAAEHVDPRGLVDLVLIGELGLDGRVRPVRGVLPAVLAAVDAGHRRVVVPRACAAEAALVPEAEVHGVDHLRGLIALLNGDPAPDPGPPPGGPPDTAGADTTARTLLDPATGRRDPLDLRDVAGQTRARRALEIAAAGGHHLALTGPPGAGKTMLAERLPGIMPPLTRHEALEVTAVHSVAGILPDDQPLVTTAPYCAPHHSATMQALVGGGHGLPRPGAVSLAHRGILFLDEAPEFAPRALEALRQPLESGHVTVARAAGVVRLPARFLLVLAANPCPCGRHGGPGPACDCGPAAVRRYRARLSGPLLDRVDLRVVVEPVTRAELLGVARREEEDSATVAARVGEARDRAAARLADTPWRINAEVPGHQLRTRWQAAPGALRAAERDVERGALTARGLDRVLRVAWTAADLRGVDRPEARDVLLALELRTAISRGVAV